MNRNHDPRINIATFEYPENKNNGIFICGINWGGSDGEENPDSYKSFFSDRKVNKYPYRERLLTWFELFGHPLIRDSGAESMFDRSITQTNWLNTQSVNTKDINIKNECINQWDNFEYHINYFRPKIIFFLSTALLINLNSKKLETKAINLFGQRGMLEIFQNDITSNGKLLKRFKVGIQKFGNTTIISLPHPTGSKGLSNEYISSFRDKIEPILCQYKLERGF